MTNSNIKNGADVEKNKPKAFTNKQVKEYAKCMADPMYFIENYGYIQHPVKGKIKFDLFDFQRRLVECYHTHRHSISLLPRQCGKSTTAAAYLLWYGLFKSDSFILIASNKGDSAKDIMRRIKYMYDECPDFLKPMATTRNVHSLEFDNNSIIKATTTTTSTARGMSISLLYLDEFAFVKPPNVAKEFWTSLSPTLATGGKCIITSTPNQDNDKFAQIWRAAQNTIDENGNKTDVGVNGFKAFWAHWNEHPDRDDEWAKIERNKIGAADFAREFECKFIAKDETLIDSMVLPTLSGTSIFHKTGDVLWWMDSCFPADKTYLISLDPSMGTGGDYAAIEVIMLPDFIQIAEWRSNVSNSKKQLETIKKIVEYIRDNSTDIIETIYWSFENNSIGEAIVALQEQLGEHYISATLLNATDADGSKPLSRKGFTTTNKAKIKACDKLKQLVESNRLTLNSNFLIQELKTFVASNASFSAKQGETDDLVMSLLIAIRMSEIIGEYDNDVYKKFTEQFDYMDDTDNYQWDIPMIYINERM